uniref:Uncharacterized protein n=1 Tax=Anguilla anguilla TaxID=7936 RepID=A0A0E9V5E7_ANGAN
MSSQPPIAALIPLYLFLCSTQCFELFALFSVNSKLHPYFLHLFSKFSFIKSASVFVQSFWYLPQPPPSFSLPLL